MFCKKCGAQITQDSNFCNSCGTKQDETTEIVYVTQTYCANCGYPVTDEIRCPKCKEIVEATTKPPVRRFSILNFISWIIAIISIIIFIAIVATVIASINKFDEKNNPSASSSKNQEGLLSRKATITDIEHSESLNISDLSTIVYITPKCDIDDLEIEINFYDENNKLLKTITKTIGDVEKGEEIKKTIPLTDFPNIFKIDYSKIRVSDGKVSYIQ